MKKKQVLEKRGINKVLAVQKYLFKFYYIGKKRYYGSQRQPNLSTIEESILNALKEKKYIIDVSTSEFEVASRTDRFVSARGAAFSFITEKTPILMEINSDLPKEIGVWAFTKVSNSFLSRFNAKLRHYKYIVSYPLKFLKSYHNLDLELMLKACKEFEGRHDFANFSKRENIEEITIRDIHSINMTIIDGYLIFDFKSKAFLRQQIRRMVKKILDVGIGIITYDEFLSLFNPNKRVSYQPANPKGLILWDIQFDKDLVFNVDIKSIKRMKKYFQHRSLEYGIKSQLFAIMQQNNFC